MAELTIFAQRLKMAREIRKMKQNELARKSQQGERQDGRNTERETRTPGKSRNG